MRSLLQSKFGVTVLALVAVVAVVWRFVPSSRTAFALVAAREPEADALAEGAAMITTNSPPRYVTALGRWKELFPDRDLHRDPFTFRSAHETSTGEVAEPEASSLLRMELQAISVQGDRSFAVINRQIVSPGERISGYTVERISSRRVILNAASGRRILEINFGDGPPSDILRDGSNEAIGTSAPLPTVKSPVQITPQPPQAP